MNSVVLLTGGNLGDISSNIIKVRSCIEQLIGHITGMSQIYSSPPWGFDSDSVFLNQVLVVETHLTPIDVLKSIWDIESGMKKSHDGYFDSCGNKIKDDKLANKVYNSRYMDIDILFFNDDIIDNEYLTIPHPLIEYRDFVLIPLCEIMPDYIHPVLNIKIKDLIKKSTTPPARR